MKKVDLKFATILLGFMFLLAGSMAPSPAKAALVTSEPLLDAGSDLAKAKNCMACHAISTKVVGPAYKDVAAKYAGQKDAEAKLVKKIINGGAGTWGAIPMPANRQVSDVDAHTLAKWVLSRK